jgi:histidinol-phosphate aminotransferase
VLVREVGPPRWLRVTVGTPEEMAAFRNALEEVLSS